MPVLTIREVAADPSHMMSSGGLLCLECGAVHGTVDLSRPCPADISDQEVADVFYESIDLTPECPTCNGGGCYNCEPY